jgi:Arc/MetJ-type ribon-helix-helix transcriptional regulator
MPRPRIDGVDERIIESFISRGIYSSQKEVIHEALRALVKEQKRKEADQQNSEEYSESTYTTQLTSLEESKKPHASMGHMARKTAVR